MYQGPLGRKTPPDFEHVVKYPRSDAVVEFQPVIYGVNWYDGYDKPVKGADGRYRVKLSGSVRGGHCFCGQPNLPAEYDSHAFYVFYDQGNEGACEGFGHSRALSLKYRATFDAFWLYDDARRYEGTYPNGEGAYNRSTCAALVKWGAHNEGGTHCVRTPWHRNAPGKSISAYHWCKTADEVRKTLGYPSTVNEIPFLNSWGTYYPETVWQSLDDVQRLLDEEGEADYFVWR